MRSRVCCVLASAAFMLAAPAPLAAQGSAAVAVVDAASGAPVVGVRIALLCAGCYGRQPTDSAGVWRRDRIPPGRYRLEAHCPSANYVGAEIADTTVVITDAHETKVELRVTPGTCDEPPYSERAGVFRGFYVPGFESSSFLPCADSATGVPAPLLPGKRLTRPEAWATFSASGRAQKIDWPKGARRDAWDNPIYFVVWRGVLKGPGNYGHMGVAAFSMVVDSVLSVGKDAPADCRWR